MFLPYDDEIDYERPFTDYTTEELEILALSNSMFLQTWQDSWRKKCFLDCPDNEKASSGLIFLRMMHMEAAIRKISPSQYWNIWGCDEYLIDFLIQQGIQNHDATCAVYLLRKYGDQLIGFNDYQLAFRSLTQEELLPFVESIIGYETTLPPFFYQFGRIFGDQVNRLLGYLS